MRRLAILILGTIVLVLGTAKHAGALQLDRDGCAELAIWGRDIIWSREMGAERAKVKSYLEQNKEATPLFKALLPFFDFLWDTKSDKTVVMKSIFDNCIQRRGNYGTDA